MVRAHMRRLLPLASIAALAFPALGARPAAANDGRNRYEPLVPGSLTHLHAPISQAAGFRVLASDMAGGADGDPAFRWAQRHAIALLRLSTRKVAVALGPGPYPLAVFDTCSENGDTPIEMTPKGPRGRHPGGSHDGGMNLDLGYYLTSEKGRIESPDPAACTEHYDLAGGKAKDLQWCTGAPDRLDADRQALFLLELGRAHDRFGRDLLENIGIDGRVRLAVLERLRGWVKAKRFGATEALVSELERLFASDPYEGWAHFHHHHIHVRFAILDFAGRHAARLDAMIEEDKRLETELLLAERGPATAGGVALQAELSSSGLARSLELHLGGKPDDLGKVAAVRFRVDGGKWEKPEGYLDPWKHVVDVPRQVDWQHRTAKVEAELQWKDGKVATLLREVALPRQPPFLAVKVEPQRVTARAKPDPGGFWVSLDWPPAYGALVTGVEWLFHRKGGKSPGPLKIAARDPSAAQRVSMSTIDPGEVTLVEAELVMSGRLRIRLAAWVNPGVPAPPAPAPAPAPTARP